MSLQTLPLKSVRPPRYRLREDIGDLAELKLSIKEHGVLEPIVVRPVHEHARFNHEIVAGHRRYMACIELGLTEIPARIVDVDDKTAFEIGLNENLQRQNMGIIEEAKAFHAYVVTHGFGSLQELAAKTGKSARYVNDRIGLLKLPNDAINLVKEEKMGAVTASELSKLDADKAREVMNYITARGTGRVYASSDEVKRTVNYVERGVPVDQAVELAISQPDWIPHGPKESEKFDPIKMARETMMLTLEKALVTLDSNIGRLGDEAEKTVWTKQIRYPLHQLLDESLKLNKKYGKKASAS